jgi:hypothetical protein
MYSDNKPYVRQSLVSALVNSSSKGDLISILFILYENTGMSFETVG